MAVDLSGARIISLLGRDFASFKRALITFSQAYASGSFTDFNESSPGMAMLEHSAYVGDVLSFYLDHAIGEMRDQTAVEMANIQMNAKMKGYRPAGKRPSVVDLYWAIAVPATVDSNGNIVPDDTYTPTLLKGSQGTANNGTVFETLGDIQFTASLGREVTGSAFDPASGLPTQFALRKKIQAIAGKTVSEDFSVTEFQAFRQIELSQPDVIEVISVVDSDGNDWLEVDYLAQDWVYSEQTNTDTDADTVPYVMKLTTAPRRFVVDRDIVTGKSKLIFGSGDGLSYDDELVPNIAAYALPLAGRATYSSISLDPQNFLRTRSLGLSPHDTTLTVKYRVGGGSESNVPSRSIRNASGAKLSFSSSGLDSQKLAIVQGNVGCINLQQATGGQPAETAQQVKLNSAAFFAAQNRIVTREDVIARVLSMPAAFGAPSKVYAKPSDGPFSYDIHILSQDGTGALVLATSTLKSNIATYLSKYRMLTDGVNILDADIVDIRCYFGVVVQTGKNKSEVITRCITRLKDFFSVDKMQIGQPIIVSDVVGVLSETPGVFAVYDVSFTNVFGITDGLQYSNFRFDVSAALSNGMVVPSVGAIFNVRNPSIDIVGSAK